MDVLYLLIFLSCIARSGAVVPIPYCPSGWYRYENTCFQLNRSPREHYEDAVTECVNRGATLASIHSIEEQRFLRDLLDPDWSYWIGLSDVVLEGSFKWADETPLDFAFFDKEQPSNHHDQDCVCMSYYYKDREWDDYRCDVYFPYICRLDLAGQPVSSTPQPDVLIPGNAACPYDWHQWGNKCYNLLEHVYKNYYDSKAYCNASGGRLFVPLNASEITHLYDKYGLSNTNFWTGCTDLANEGYWICEGYDSADIHYHFSYSTVFSEAGYWAWKMSPREPNNANDNENCMQFVTPTEWNDNHCKANVHSVLCEQQAYSYMKPTDDIPTSTVTTKSELVITQDTLLDYCDVLPRRYDITDMGLGCYFRGWADVQGQGSSNDYCRVVGLSSNNQQYFSCALAGTAGESEYNFNSPNASDVWFDVGYGDTWYMKDEDGDGKDDYCRCVGTSPDTYVSCMKAGETGFIGQYDFTPSGATTNCAFIEINPFLGPP